MTASNLYSGSLLLLGYFFVLLLVASKVDAEIDLSGYVRVSPGEPIAIWKSLDGEMSPSVVPSAMEALKDYVGDSVIECIAVVGEYHSGKSSFNNALLSEDIFLVASDIPPQTQGFEVVVLKHPDQRKPAIILVDTPGSGAADFVVEEQAALFGAAYLMSTTLIFNSIRQVGTTISLEWLADRLRYVKSTIPMVPTEVAFPEKAADLDMHWVINNVDLMDPQASSDEQLHRFIHDHNKRRFELNSIFPNDIHPFTLPTPGGPDLLRYMRSNESQWTEEYSQGIQNFRKKLFSTQSTKNIEEKRIFKSFHQWEEFVKFAFAEPTSRVLKGLTYEADRAAKGITTTLLVENALNAAKEKFHVESQIEGMEIISKYKIFLNELLDTCVNYCYSRAIAVDKKDMEATVKNSLEPNLQSSIRARIREMEDLIRKNISDAVQQGQYAYDDILLAAYPIPYDPTTIDTSKQRQEATSLAIMNIGRLSVDANLVRTVTKDLGSIMKDTDKHHDFENIKKIVSLVNLYSERVHTSFESTANVISSNWNVHAQPDPDMIRTGKNELEKKRFYHFSAEGYADAGLPSWISKTKEMKEEINQALIKIKGLLAKLEENQDQRVYNYGQKMKESFKHNFEESLLSDLVLPTTTQDINVQVTRLKNLMIDGFRKELGALSAYPSVGIIAKELDEFGESRRVESHMHNEDEWKRLIEEPVKIAKTKFMRHMSDHCGQLSTSKWIFDFSCSKIDSITGLLSSRTGIARDLIFESIDRAIKNEKVADHDHIKSNRPKYARISDISRQMMRKITVEKIRDWGYDARLLAPSSFWFSYLVFGITSVIGMVTGMGLILSVGLAPVGFLIVALSIFNCFFLYV